MKNILIGLLVFSAMGSVLAWSEHNDNVRNVAYDKCMSQRQYTALPLPEYLQDCMSR